MNRDKIKRIVYNSAIIAVGDYIKDICMKSPNDGEDLFLYTEIGFDALDMYEFLEDIESFFKVNKNIKLFIPEEVITTDVTFRKIIDYIENKLNG